jgi:hypothetical protein
MIGRVDRLTNELLDADGGEGAEIKKKENVHRSRKRIKRSRITGGNCIGPSRQRTPLRMTRVLGEKFSLKDDG